MTRGCRDLFLFGFVFFAIVLGSFGSVQAFSIGNPFKAVGDALGGVARGVGNIFGQGLAGFAQPTIHTFADEANKLSAEVIAKIDVMATNRINQLDSVIGARINQVDDVMAKNIEKVDLTISDKIKNFDLLLDQKIGAVDIVATKAIQSAEDSFVRIIRYAAILFLIAALVGVLAYMIITRSRALPPQSIQIGVATTGVAAILVFAASFFLTPPAGEKVALLSKDFEKAAFAAYRNAELNDAVTLAKQLTVIHPADSGYYAFHKLAEIQRDILYRPTVIKSIKGTNELLPRVRRVSQLIEEIGLETKTDKFSVFVKQEVAATAAVVLWQLASTREQEQMAICSAADALGELSQADGADVSDKIARRGSAFTWLAFGYLQWAQSVYLGNSKDFRCAKRDGKSDTKTTAFSELLTTAKPLIEAFAASASEAPESIRAIVSFNTEATKYFKEASRLYTGMIVHDAQWQLSASGDRSETSKKNHQIERDRLAEELIAQWSNFSSLIEKNAAIKSSDIVMAATGLPAALAIRAHKIRYVSDVNQRMLAREGCVALVNLMKDKPADAQQQFGKDPLYLLARMYSAPVRNLLCVEQTYFDGVLSGTEKELTLASAQPQKAEEAKQQAAISVARSEVLTALVTCITESGDAKLLGHVACNDEDFRKGKQLQPFMEWLTRQQTTPNVPVSAPRYAMVR